MITTQFIVTLKLQAPILTHTSGSIGFGLDSAMQRDKFNRPVFNGSLIRGNLRHAWESLKKITGQPSREQIDDWLGKEADTQKQIPHRADLNFSEYWVDKTREKHLPSGKRYRISIDEYTGAVKSGALQVIESPYAIGDTAKFTGTITTSLNKNEAKELKIWLERAFAIIPAIGALKTNGFGKIIKTTIDQEDIKPLATLELNTELLTQTQFGLRIKPDRAFCFAKPAIGENNHFESEIHIPAAAIVAAIAATIEGQENYTLLRENLSKLHFTHARAVPSGFNKRPIALPLSLVYAKDQFHNIADKSEADVISGSSPSFLIDWKYKQFAQAQKMLNQSGASPDIQLKIRTKINPETDNADDQQLFSMETVSPDDFDWLSTLNIEKIASDIRKDIIEQLHKLFKHPLSPMGKTKASAIASLDAIYPYTLAEQSIQANDSQVIIYLQSPARLLNTGFYTTGTNQGDELSKAYYDAWWQISKKTLRLSHFFAQQKLEGGEHWRKRFRSKEEVYHPEIFTREGSVFILEITDIKKAIPLLNTWREEGLPQLAHTPGGENWEENPWIAANGYGEIAVNLDITGGIKND